MALTETIAAKPALPKNSRDVFFALGIVIILAVLFLPIPAFLIDIGLAFSIALSVLILMVGLWIQRPLDFSAFPTVLLIATMLRLSLNIATTRMILSHGNEGTHADAFALLGSAAPGEFPLDGLGCSFVPPDGFAGRRGPWGAGAPEGAGSERSAR